MKKEIKERVEAHKKAYKDLCLWLDEMYANDIKMLFGKSSFSYREWLNRDEPQLIEGASVTLEIKLGFQSEEMEYLMMLLGTKSYRVSVYPLGRIQLVFKVPIMNNSKVAMTCTGKWTPYWRKYEKKDGNA